MTRRLLATYLSLAVVVLAALEIPLGVTNTRNERRALSDKVERDAVSIASLAESTLEGDSTANRPALGALARGYASDTGGRVVIVDRRGSALVDSNPPAPGTRSFASRPELAAALRGDVVTGTRSSSTLGSSFLYVAVPVASGGKIFGAVRVSYPTSTLDRRVRRYWLILALIAAVVLAVSAVLGAAFARWIRKPIAELETAAARVSAGDLDARAAPPSGPPELVLLVASFNEMVAQLDALVSSQRDFVADASHELRTPLTALRLRLENLEPDVAPGGRSGLDAAVREIGRLSAIVESLLALARADAGAAQAERVEAATLVRERLEAWQDAAAAAGVTLRPSGDERLVVQAAPDRLTRVLDNLIRNGLDASPPNGAVTVAVDAAAATLTVSDEGPGMTAQEKQRAFDRFWRGGRGGKEGSGLGLAIARRLVEADGGTIELADATSGGLAVRIRLRPAPS